MGSTGRRGVAQRPFSTYPKPSAVCVPRRPIEYNVFPYSQSTRRQLRIEYNVGYTDFAYHDTTIFDRIREGMPNQQLQVNVATREPWGSIDVGVSAISYLNDRTKYRLGSFGELDLKIFRGLSFDIEAGYDVIRDQFGLAKERLHPWENPTRRSSQGPPTSISAA